MQKFSDAAMKVINMAVHAAEENGNPVVTAAHICGAFLDTYRDEIQDLDLEFYNKAEKAVSSILATLPTTGFKKSIDSAVLDTLSKSCDAVGTPMIYLANLFSLFSLFADYPKNGSDILAMLSNYDPPEFEKTSHSGMLGESDESFDWHSIATDMIQEAKDNDKPLIGRDTELKSVERTLLRHDKPNPVIIGEPGVGKTAIVEGFAKAILNGDVPNKLKSASLYRVDIASLVAGTQYRGQFEDRLKKTVEGIIDECEMPIIFIDEIHMLVGAGSSSNNTMDAANILKPYLTGNKIRVIGATTYEEYRTSIEKDAALERRFHPVKIDEPSIEDTKKIIAGIINVYEKHHSVRYSKAAISAAVELSAKYINDRHLPDKAIDVIDEAGASRSLIDKHIIIGVKDIEAVVEKIAKIPKITSEQDDLVAVRNLATDLAKAVFGQDQAIKAVSDAIKISKSGLVDVTKPIGSFLFVGPSGVGKTELAKQIANQMNVPLIRFDMSEYMEAHSVAKLTGAPAGYVGYEDGGILTETIRKTPNCVVLFDEIEKAHPDVFKIFLQIMDYGTLSDNKGRKADFRHTIIIMTSNAGATSLEKKSRPLGFNQVDTVVQQREADIMEAVNSTFAPEFRGRLTKIVIFNGMNDKMSHDIVRKELEKLSAKLKTKKIYASFSDETVDQLAKIGISSTFGARNVQQTIDDQIRKLFVDAIIDGIELHKCKVDFDNGEFKIV